MSAGGVRLVDPPWTPERLELLSWFDRHARSLGELYAGAVVLLHENTLPGRIRLVSHALREIKNRLPDAVVVQDFPDRFDATGKLKRLHQTWDGYGLMTDESLFSADAQVVADDASATISIPRLAVTAAVAVLRDHDRVRITNRDKAKLLFQFIAPENKTARMDMAPIVNQWTEVADWFMSLTHDAGKCDVDCDDERFRDQFMKFEQILMSLTRRFYSAVDELDTILDATNS